MNCEDLPSIPSPHKTFQSHFPPEKRKALREWMTSAGYGNDRNLMVWYFIPGSGWDLVPIEMLLAAFGDYLQG